MLSTEADSHVKQSNDYAACPARAWFAFVMIFLLMLSDYMDRQIVVSLFPHLKQEWGLSNKQLAALFLLISVMVAVGSLPVARMADRFGRVKSIVVMASVWSMAAIACVFVRNDFQLFTARTVVGLGETGDGAAGTALLKGLFPKRWHSTLLGAFFAASALGGVIADHWGWHAAFSSVAILSVVCFWKASRSDEADMALVLRQEAVGKRMENTAVLLPFTAAQA
ncbi:MFS transporter [Comamonas sp. lk]|uniref:MFS transporter n=1 Tax=Comamonas sp. lk TaxID=2201272 RepID=UPI001F08F3F7|nr:MFS transporter [Comamonas sp. lk]